MARWGISWLTFLAAMGAYAASGDPLTLTAGVTTLQDNNLFRIPDGSTLENRSDSLVASYAGIKVDKSWSLQKLQLNATVTDYHYRTYSQLNFLGKNYAASWNWALTPHFTGSLGVEGGNALTSFADFKSGTDGNIRTTQTRRASGDGWIGGGWHLLGSMSSGTSTNSQVFTAVDSSSTRTLEGGLKYIAASGSVLSLVQRQGRGEYPNRTANSFYDNRFDRRVTLVSGTWQASGKSVITASAGRVIQSYPIASIRDFSGATGSFEHVWTPTGKLQITTALKRELGEWQDVVASYTATDTLSLSPAWLVSEKVSLQLSAKRTRKSFRGGIVSGIPLRRDDTRSLQAGLAWNPTRQVSVNLSVQNERRDSVPVVLYSANQYADRSVSLDLRVSY